MSWFEISVIVLLILNLFFMFIYLRVVVLYFRDLTDRLYHYNNSRSEKINDGIGRSYQKIMDNLETKIKRIDDIYETVSYIKRFNSISDLKILLNSIEWEIKNLKKF